MVLLTVSLTGRINMVTGEDTLQRAREDGRTILKDLTHQWAGLKMAS